MRSGSKNSRSQLACIWLVLSAFACERAPEGTARAPEPVKPPTESAPAATPSPKAAPTESAQLGQPAPDFTLQDLDGQTFQLSALRGKTVVLEWFNPGCPFVQLSHTKGSLVNAAEPHQPEGVVWLAINSAAPGKQGHSVDENRKALQDFGMKYPVLVDAEGTVGRKYGAERTPHLYVIDPSGVLVYRGAIDNSPDGEGASPEGGQLVRYVDQALTELAAGKPISVPETKSYGCTVKYAN